MKKSMIVATNTTTKATAYFVVPTANVSAFCECLGSVEAEYKAFESDTMKFADLPEEVRKEAKETLKVYDKVNVYFEYNRFEVTANTCIRSHYNHDHFFCGTYYAKDVYTKEERAEHLKELNSYEFPEWAW